MNAGCFDVLFTLDAAARGRGLAWELDFQGDATLYEALAGPEVRYAYCVADREVVNNPSAAPTGASLR